MIRCIIIDDEVWARQKIKTFLKDLSDIELIAETSNGKNAIKLILKLKPDLIFLDIQMPLMNGFEMLNQLNITPLPMVIFTTAHEQHALEAFDAHAIDYLLKPYDRDRFKNAIDHVKSFRSNNYRNEFTANIENLLSSVQQKITIKDNGAIYLIQINKIKWIEASGNYIKIKTEKEFLHRNTLHDIESKLDNRFIRVHRSFIVNIEYIEKLEATNPNEFNITMIDGTSIKSSRSYRQNLNVILK